MLNCSMNMQSTRSKLWETLQVKFLGSSMLRENKGWKRNFKIKRELKDIIVIDKTKRFS